MNKIDEIISYTKKNKCDLYSHTMFLMNLINSHNITSVFTNNYEIGHIANFIKYVDGKIILNSQNKNETDNLSQYENLKCVNKDLEKINIGNYQLIQIDCSHKFENWSLYIARIIRLNPKFIVLCNTKKEPENSKIILNTISRSHYNIDTTFEDYYGMITLKYMSEWKN